MVKTGSHVKQNKSDAEKQISYAFSHAESSFKKNKDMEITGELHGKRRRKKKEEKKQVITGKMTKWCDVHQ